VPVRRTVRAAAVEEYIFELSGCKIDNQAWSLLATRYDVRQIVCDLQSPGRYGFSEVYRREQGESSWE